MTHGRAAALAFLALFALYLRTLHPAWRLDDSPETAAAAVNLGVQHAPGYPLATMVGKLASAVPVGGVRFRVNLAAAALMAGAAVTVGAATRMLVGGPVWAGFLAVLAFGASALGWHWAVTAKGLVYGLNLLLVLGCLLSAAGGRSVAAGLFFGCALANHWMGAVWWLPGALLLARPWSIRKAATGAFAAALGLSAYIQLPLSALREPAWGDAGSAGGFLALVFLRDFAGRALGHEAMLLPLQFLEGLFLPLKEGGPLFALLAVAGAVAAWRAGRGRAAAVLAAGFLTIVAVTAGANPLNRATGTLSFWLTDRFLLPWLAASAALFGGGILLLRAALPVRARGLAWLVGAAVPAILLAGGFRGADHSRDYLGFDYARNVVGGCRGARALFAEAYTQAFPLYDAAWVEGSGPPLVVTVPFLAGESGWRRLARRLPEAGDGALLAVPLEDRSAALAGRLMAGGPVYHLTMCSDPLLKERLAWRGIACEVLPAGARSPSPTRAGIEGRFKRMRLRGLWSRSPAKDEAAWTVLDVYGVAASAAADGAVRAGKAEEALAEWDHALKVPGRLSRIILLGAAGNALLSLGRVAEAENRFREAVAIEPLNPAPWVGLATACAFQGRRADAIRYGRWVLRWHPGNPGASRLVARLGG